MINNDRRTTLIRERLESAFAPEFLEIENESHLHAGHAGAQDGRGHFRVTLISDRFQDQSRLQRHRMVYEALGPLMETDIHALAVRALTPDEI